MTNPAGNYFSTHDGLRLFYRDFAAADARADTVLCLHGLTRNSGDFLELAAHLQPHYRVLAPDMRGRGHSQYDPQWRNYQPLTYVRDMFDLIDALQLDRIAVIGTSLGAFMAMFMAAQQPQRIAGITLNDAGPEIDPRGLARIAQYAGARIDVRNWDDAARYIKTIYGDALWGLRDEEWMKYAKLSYRENAEGIPVPDYDPNIGAAFREATAPRTTPTANTTAVATQDTPPPDMWPVFAQITHTPMLVIRGEHSDILSAATVQRMVRTRPDLHYIAVPNRGHAPLLNEPVCLTAIDNFLAQLQFNNG